MSLASQIALYLSTISEYVLSSCASSLGRLPSEGLLLVPCWRRLVVIRLLYEHYLLRYCVLVLPEPQSLHLIKEFILCATGATIALMHIAADGDPHDRFTPRGRFK